jgi:V/A-type H+-transporting ATPase subunit C
MEHSEYEQTILDFYIYPPVGVDDWRYQYQTALVRMYEMQLLGRATLLDMANAESFEQAADLLSATEYALPQGSKSSDEMENLLLARRYAVRQFFADSILDKPLVHLFKTRDDFANLRLALRRILTGKPAGRDYSNDGNVTPELFEQIFSEEADEAAKLPDYMQQAVDQATLAYYQSKDIRQIDYTIDSEQAKYNLKIAQKIKNIFLIGLFRIQIDLTNIRTMFRLKFTQSQDRFQQPSGRSVPAEPGDNVLLKGGYLTLERLKLGLDTGYESLGQLFFATPYYRVVETAAAYLASEKSFLKVEQQCDEHLTEFLKSTIQIITGPQPIIAYLLMKENEIRTVRLILTAKKNFLDTKLILDRLG